MNDRNTYHLSLYSVAMMPFVGNMSLIDAGRALLSLPQALLYPPPQTTSAPLVTVRNGTYSGVYNSQYDQDYFVGVPFAQVPPELTLVATAG